MLGKLYKHEWKETSRYLLPIHVIGLIIALAGGFFLRSLDADTSSAPITVYGVIATMLVFVALSFGTILLLGIQYYKSLYSDEAYLTHTLPVKRSTLLHVKMIIASFWIFVDGIIVSMGIFLWTIPLLSSADKAEMLQMYFSAGLSASVAVVGYAVLMIIGAFTSVLLLYTCISIGQFFTNHRIIGAIIAYIVINSIMQLIVILAMSGAGIISYSINIGDTVASSSSMGIPNIHYYLIFMFLLSIVTDAIKLIVGYFVCRYSLTKNVNLY